MTNVVYFAVRNCAACPNVGSERYYTEDSFDTEFIYKCKAKKESRDYKVIGIYSWNEIISKIPDWCPLRSNDERKS